MKLRRLEILQLAGIRPGFVLDGLDPGVNLVIGPNASGKSSLVRALRHLLAGPGRQSEEALTLSAEFVAGDDAWQVARSGSHVVWRKNGQSAVAPSLPAGDFLHCYWMGMDDLLEAGSADRAIGERLRRELFGGFDLQSLRDLNELAVGQRHGQTQEREWREAWQQLQAIENEYAALERDRQRLPELRQAKQQAQEAEARAGKLHQALDLLVLQRERLAAQAVLQEFPANLHKLAGDERSRLESLETRRDQLREEQREALQRHRQLAQAIQSSGLADDPPEAAAMAARRSELDEVRTLRAQQSDRERQLQRAQAQETDAWAALGETRPTGMAAEATPSDPQESEAWATFGDTTSQQPPVTPEDVDQVARLAHRLQQALLRVQRLDAAAADPTGADPTQLSAYETLAAELRRWLRLAGRTTQRLLLAAGIGTSLLGAVLAGLSLSRDEIGLAAVSGGVVLIGAMLLGRFFAAAGTRREIVKRIAEQQVPEPPAWHDDAVETYLRSVDDELLSLRERNRQAQEAERARHELALAQQELTQLERQKNQLAAQIGVDAASVTAEGVQRFFALMERLDRARTERIEAENALATEQQTIRTHLERVASWLHRYGVAPREDAHHEAAIRAAWGALESQVHALQRTREACSAQETLLARIERDLTDVDQQLERLYRQSGLLPDERQTLLYHCEIFHAYRRQLDAVHELQIRERERRHALQDDDEWLARIDADDEAGLRATLHELEIQAQRAELLREELSTLEVKLQQAGAEYALERARARFDMARDALADGYDEAMLAAAGHFLLDEIVAEHRAEHEPAVLQNARERFGRYTANRYRLGLEDGVFSTYDTVTEAPRTLAELSTGTRMQLLLAVRLAWTATLEAGSESLPLFLDEALTTSDPERFAAIARSLHDAAIADDRQLFYLSSQPADAARWQQATGQQPHSVDLLTVRFGGKARMAEDFALPKEPELPAPDRDTPESYAARLTVPGIDPAEEAGRMHVFHLLRDDLGLLHRLMQQWRVRALGPLQALLESEAGEHAVADPSMRRRLHGRCRIARAWLDAWRLGRGRRVDRDALERSGIVTASFLDAICELAESLSGDAQALIDALRAQRVARFQQNRVARLAEWFEEQGYLDSHEVLAAEEREQHVLRQWGAEVFPEEIRFIVHNLEAASTRT